MPRTVIMEWPDLKTSVPFVLADSENKELCDAFWNGLPFQTIFIASMSGGQMFKVPLDQWLPDEKAKRVLIPEFPPGNIFSIGAYTLLVKYGDVIEPFKAPKLGMMTRAGLSTMMELVDKLKEDYWISKAIHPVVFKKAAEK